MGDKSVKIVPDLATSWTQSNDGKTWTFKLRSGVKFHDGTPVDAAAVQFTFNRLFKLNQGAVGDFAAIDQVDAPDPLTVVFHLKTPFPSFLTSLTTLWGPGIVSPKTVHGAPGQGRSGPEVAARPRRRLRPLDGQAVDPQPEDRARSVPRLLEGLVRRSMSARWSISGPRPPARSAWAWSMATWISP